ncbi:hypothetical protein JQ596_09150 [Bradyrhizobium manausense]|uniref:hypothetical protein n=1 Tax=Bradyrhizobium manausense TaxID=989370 RepID=UPI001BADE57A|nr:hypothetical protein [Bradyrhizobium manausense]MBR0825704.1 hypothetical protein [Bradyrhizobium manausense]
MWLFAVGSGLRADIQRWTADSRTGCFAVTWMWMLSGGAGLDIAAGRVQKHARECKRSDQDEAEACDPQIRSHAPSEVAKDWHWLIFKVN